MPEPNACAATAPCQDCGPLRLAEFLPYRLSVVAESVSQAFAARYAEEFGLGVSTDGGFSTRGQPRWLPG
ncbi:hypothetical protein [Roseomonas gilardii]|uniref:hypothetical protein n=1 Tax=Roseomonas gilardii TaxID=257708 RepID=UPI0011A63F33|nr:hypothetical protein [Roseomonas gilardii]